MFPSRKGGALMFWLWTAGWFLLGASLGCVVVSVLVAAREGERKG